jgi:hypothetical protein
LRTGLGVAGGTALAIGVGVGSGEGLSVGTGLGVGDGVGLGRGVADGVGVAGRPVIAATSPVWPPTAPSAIKPPATTTAATPMTTAVARIGSGLGRVVLDIGRAVAGSTGGEWAIIARPAAGGRCPGHRHRGVVGEPGLEPGTSGI